MTEDDIVEKLRAMETDMARRGWKFRGRPPAAVMETRTSGSTLTLFAEELGATHVRIFHAYSAAAAIQKAQAFLRTANVPA